MGSSWAAVNGDERDRLPAADDAVPDAATGNSNLASAAVDSSSQESPKLIDRKSRARQAALSQHTPALGVGQRRGKRRSRATLWVSIEVIQTGSDHGGQHPVHSVCQAAAGWRVSDVVAQCLIDGVGEASLQHAQGFQAAVAPALRRAISSRAGGWQRAWVIAMRCSAALSCRFPVRLSRCRARFDDHTGSGAVPLWRA